MGRKTSKLTPQWALDAIYKAKRDGDNLLDLSGYEEEEKLEFLPPEIFSLSRLDWLDLSGNQLKTFNSKTYKLTRLNWLNLRDNRLKTVPNPVAQLVNLQNLDLSNNRLSVIPKWLFHLPNLRTLYLDGNPIQSPPPEILKLAFHESIDLNASRDYFRQQESGVIRLYEAKLLIVGEPGAGKTSLTRKLLEPTAPLAAKDESTEGIDVHTWSFPLKQKSSGQNLQFRVNIWDFGGQEIYYATHQFFLSRRSLYIIVADAREQKTDFFYWLNLIEHLSDRSPAFIFNNEIQNRHWAINEQQLLNYFPDSLRPIFAFNLADDKTRLEDLRQKIKQQISQLPHVGDELPATWVIVRNALEKEQRHTVSLTEFLQLCQTYGFTRREDSLQLSSYLHDLGVILHFQDDPRLKHTVILKPEWVTGAVYGVLDNEQVKANFGRFSRANLRAIWQGTDYIDLLDELLVLMEKFQLCYEIPGQTGQYIAPQLLGEQPPDYDLMISGAVGGLHLRYKYETFMPKGLLSRFIVTMHQHIASQGKWVWRTGLILEKDGAQAEIIELYHWREIRIRVLGRNRKDLLTIISYELDKLHSAFHRLEYDKLIPCNCPTCRDSNNPNSYPLKMLQRFKVDQQPQIMCTTSYQMINVQSLIDDVGTLSHSSNLAALLLQLESAFSEEEARRICFDLGIDYDDLGGRGRSANLRELVTYADRNGRLMDLIQLAQAHKPLSF